jgi:hypothetical protein
MHDGGPLTTIFFNGHSQKKSSARKDAIIAATTKTESTDKTKQGQWPKIELKFPVCWCQRPNGLGEYFFFFITLKSSTWVEP